MGYDNRTEPLAAGTLWEPVEGWRQSVVRTKGMQQTNTALSAELSIGVQGIDLAVLFENHVDLFSLCFVLSHFYFLFNL